MKTMEQKERFSTSDKFKIFAVLMTCVSVFAGYPYSEYIKSAIVIPRQQLTGWIFMALITLLTMYSLRKRFLIMFVGDLTYWYGFHFYIALLAIVLLVPHSDFALGFGLENIIFLLIFFMFINGVYGFVVQTILPEVLMSPDAKPDTYDEVMKKLKGDEKEEEHKDNKERQKGIIEEIKELEKGKSESFLIIIKTEVKRIIMANEGVRPLLKQIYRKDFCIKEQMSSLTPLEKNIPQIERDHYRKLLDFYGEKYLLDKQLVFIMLMNNWVKYHIVSGFLLVSVMVAHIISFYYY